MLVWNYKGPHYDDWKCPDNVHCLKTNHSHAHILSKERPFSQKYSALMSFFQKFCMINMSLSLPMCGQKTSILSKLHYIMSPKSQKETIFSNLSQKNNCSHAHISSKNRPFAENYTAFVPIFCHKNVNFLKNMCYHAIFSIFSQIIPYSHAHIWSKYGISVKLHKIMGQKSQ